MSPFSYIDMKENVLVIIPARGGSKGIPHKNIKELGGKPLICYSIDVARLLTNDENICVTTDDEAIIKVVSDYGLKVPFKRPDHLATDTCGSDEVIRHAYQFYKNQGKQYDVILLLQPTSPFRRIEDLRKSLAIYDDSLDMVVSVKETSANPYYNCYEEDADGFLIVSKGDGKFVRRQDAPPAFEWNGSVYVINPDRLMEVGMSGLTKVKKYVMDELHSIDLDTMFDWKVAELILKENLIKI